MLLVRFRAHVNIIVSYRIDYRGDVDANIQRVLKSWRVASLAFLPYDVKN